ncbi:hypothetical protein BCV72DRAFT_66703 [Rhizopus microsporus var. microsporus]|uniref:Uncharacterized protein n=1 Tax=Rhizopus microsporus var. microsporus TaxID=86635 RepID=A0A1X0RB99_RHIZD|nr:hypothetical protein BCV72DRAFT_66703 [Rhizopus microsporus var. microsporus]
MLPDQRTSFYDTLPMLNSWYESKPIKQEPPKQRTCLVSFSSEPPTVHTCKIKRPDIQRRTSSSDSVKEFFKHYTTKLSKLAS